jgi:Uma2 family endonuclease
MTVAIAKWTIDEYHQMIAVGILNNRHVELLKGEIVEMSPEGEAPTAFKSKVPNRL